MLFFSKAYWLAAKERLVHTLPFFQRALLLHRDRQYLQKEEEKNSYSTNMCILGDFLSCQVARTKPQEDAKMLSNPWKVNKSTISIRIKKVQKVMLLLLLFSFSTGKTWFILPNTLKIGLYVYNFFCHFLLNDYVSNKTEQQLKEEKRQHLHVNKQEVFTRLYYFSFFFHFRNI